MIIKQTVKEFESLGFGMFLHFGLYSILDQGEWTLFTHKLDPKPYEALAKEFSPKIGWAREIAACAKAAGCKYITITTRHHDGYSLFDTCGLTEYDAPHFCGRDLIREYVDACREYGLIPFFYHTLLDWHEPTFKTDFKEYLKYLRASVEVLCTKYGKIGGLWFDGKWSKPNDDWEEDALYAMIRSHQPDAIIINNTGLSARGAAGHIELDSVTYERGMPTRLPDDAPKYLAGEMCEVLCSHWGCASRDLSYKSPSDMIHTLAGCRRYGANLLLNLGPTADGSLRTIDKAIIEILGKWVAIHDEAIRKPRPVYIDIEGKPDNFLLRDGNTYYLFCDHLPTVADPNVTVETNPDGYTNRFPFEGKVRSVTWMDNGEVLPFTLQDGTLTIQTTPFLYGRNTVVRVAKIICE